MKAAGLEGDTFEADASPDMSPIAFESYQPRSFGESSESVYPPLVKQADKRATRPTFRAQSNNFWIDVPESGDLKGEDHSNH